MHYRIGILGGSFDPIHSAHIAAARIALDTLTLNRVVVVPAGVAYHRDRTIASPEQRLRMVELAIEGEPQLVASAVDIQRSGNTYSIDTIVELKEQFGSENPGDTANWFFIMGEDAFASFESWKESEQIVKECELVVISRPGFPDRHNSSIPAHHIHVPGWEVSSSDIRTALTNGQSVEGLVPAPVVDYIASNKLYAHD